MHRINYNDSGVFIDSCTKCHHRWLDRGELHKIANKISSKQKTPEELLFLADLDQKMRDIDKQANQSAYSDAALYDNPMSGVLRSSAAGDERRTLGLLSGAALYGMVVGMLKSKLLRILIPLMLIFIFLIFRYVISELS